MVTNRLLPVVALLLVPAAFTQSRATDHGLAVTVDALDTIAKSTQAAVESVRAVDKAGRIPKATVSRILDLCEKISAAERKASSITHGVEALAPAQQASILSILNPIVAALQDSITNGLAPITDKEAKTSVQMPLRSVQASLSTIQNTLAEGAGITYVGHERGEVATLADALSQNGWAECGPGLANKCLAVATGPGLLVGYRFRSKPNEPEIHQDEAEIDYVVAGSATFVIGGTLVGPRNLGSGEVKGSSIDGGQTEHFTKGDVIVIPAGMPHWFKEIQEPINYFMVHQTVPRK